MSTTIRVHEATRDRLAQLALTTGKPMIAVVDDALDALERRNFFAAYNDRYRQLRDEPDAWTQIEAERDLESVPLLDSTS